MQAVSKIFSDISKSVGAGGTQFLLTLATTPIMTRLYTPDDYATFGILLSMATAIIGIGMLSLPNAFPLEKDTHHRGELLAAMARLLMTLVLLAVAIAAIVGAFHLVQADRISLALLPLLVLTFGLRQIMVSIATARAYFSGIAFSQVVEPLCSRGGSIAFGAMLSGHPAWILGSVAAGHLATAATLLSGIHNRAGDGLRTLLTTRFAATDIYRRYHDFILYNTASQQMQPLVLLGLQLAIAALFSHDTAGLYILAGSILTLPASLIALTTAPVIYRHFIELDHTSPQKLASHFKRAMVAYLLAGALVLSPVFFFGEWLFTIAFGEQWAHAGAIAASLSPAYIGSFALAGVQSIFRVTRRLKTAFRVEAITGIALLIAAILIFHSTTIDHAMVALSLLWVLRHVVLLGTCIHAVNHHAHERE